MDNTYSVCHTHNRTTHTAGEVNALRVDPDTLISCEGLKFEAYKANRKI